LRTVLRNTAPSPLIYFDLLPSQLTWEKIHVNAVLQIISQSTRRRQVSVH
jgi:hypothetical protein